MTTKMTGETFSFNMKYATYEDVEFRECTFPNIEYTHFKDCAFIDCVMSRKNISSSAFTHCAFLRVALQAANLSGVTFENCTLGNVDAEGSMWRTVHFHNSTLSWVNFTLATLTEVHQMRTPFISCNLSRSTVESIQVDNSTWTDVDFTGGTWRYSQIEHGSITGSNFTNSRLYSIGGTVDLKRNLFVEAKISNSVVEPTTRKVKCRVCKTLERKELLQKGMCRECIRQKGYSDKNMNLKGKESRLPSFSFEFEVHVRRGYTPVGENDPTELIPHGFLRSSDSSVDDEYKSPIYLDGKAFSRVLPLMDKLAEEWVDDHCGTHIHVGFDNRLRLNCQFNRVFGLMTQRMRDRIAETEAFWGRYFTHYCNGESTSRYCWCNTTSASQPTIEFRIARFRNARQFRNVVMFCRRVAKYLDAELDRPRSTEAYERIAQHVLTMYEEAIKSTLVTA